MTTTTTLSSTVVNPTSYTEIPAEAGEWTTRMSGLRVFRPIAAGGYRRRWSVTWLNKPVATADSIETLARGLRTTAGTWKPPETATTYTVVCIDIQNGATMYGKGGFYRSITVTLEEQAAS